MSQTSPITLMAIEKAQGLQALLFASVNEPSTGIHHFLKVLALSPTALSAYSELQSINQNGNLDKPTSIRIALTLAAHNQCQSSLALHTASARKAGFNSSEIDSNCTGTSQDAKGAVAVQFARNLANLSTNSAKVSTEQWRDIRLAGYNDAEILEIISHVGMNLLGNELATNKEIESSELIEAPSTA
ncbi:MAG: carboxymuconolactone decarboxylase family protein [Bermanella sp.]